MVPQFDDEQFPPVALLIVVLGVVLLLLHSLGFSLGFMCP